MNQFDGIRRVVRYGILQRAQNYFDSSKISEIPIPESKLLVYGTWMTFVLLAGDGLRIVIKFQYDLDQLVQFASFISDELEEKASAVMKEYSNLASGFVKTLLEEVGVEVGTSLPVSTMAFDEVFQKYVDSEHKSRDVWGLKLKDSVIVCMTEVEILDASLFKTLDHLASRLNNIEDRRNKLELF